MANLELEKIKLIIWDLDDTFWKGTISEEVIVPIDSNIQILKNATDAGVINSICSKNDFEVAKSELENLGVWDLFVFPSINWENKALRIKSQIEQMGLRPVNVLFLDDNEFNINEVNHFLPDLMTAMPVELPEISRYFSNVEKTDLKHKRLNQYKILEEKSEESLKYDNNEAFLFDSNIQVNMHTDCEPQLDRLHEMILRTNQLNFTKNRITKEELEKILESPDYQNGYVTVKDRFGDYGIVGFYAMKNNLLEHFLFSCRTMGQGIEQYVYSKLNFPKIEIEGEVQAELIPDYSPAWINQKTQIDEDKKSEEISSKILLKGPCDLSSAIGYIKSKEAIATEFTYVNPEKNNTIEGHNHSAHILGLMEYTEQEKNEIANDCMFIDRKMLDGTFFTSEYDIIFLSTLIESFYGIYQKKGTNIKIAFANHKLPLTQRENWQYYIQSNVYGNNFTLEYLEEFSNKYEFIGYTSPEEYINFLSKTLNYLSSNTTICLILGSEFPYDLEDERHKLHQKLNQKIIEFAKKESRIKYIELNSLTNSKKDFRDNINHFQTRVYYNIAQEILKITQDQTQIKLKGHAISKAYYVDSSKKIRKKLRKMISPNSNMYKILKPIYVTYFK